jgi:hypothetical protein
MDKKFFKRKGILKISEIFLFENPECVQKVLSYTIPVIVKMNHFENIYEYYAYSDKFDIIEDGRMPPLYTTEVTTLFANNNPIDYEINFVRQ